MGPEFQLLEWDTQHFGVRIGRVMLREADDEAFRRASEWARLSSIDCMYLLTNATDGSAIQLASEWGWRLVDPRITLEGQVSTIAKSSRGVRPATEDDITQLRELASRSHRDSRFYADGNFSKH